MESDFYNSFLHWHRTSCAGVLLQFKHHETWAVLWLEYGFFASKTHVGVCGVLKGWRLDLTMVFGGGAMGG